MRYYLIDRDQNEYRIDLIGSKVHSPELVEFQFQNGKVPQKVFIRQLAGKYFSSFDGKSWHKIAKQNLPRKILHVDKTMDLYRGYKPSGLSAGGEGELLTQMPGKVVKIPVEVGQSIEKGQTLVVLEAMKMENEIKSSLSGTVKAIHVKEGQALEQGVLMMEVEGE